MGSGYAPQLSYDECDALLFFDLAFEPLSLQLSFWLTSLQQLLVAPCFVQPRFLLLFQIVPALFCGAGFVVVGIGQEKLKKDLKGLAGTFAMSVCASPRRALSVFSCTLFCVSKMLNFELCSVSYCSEECIIHTQLN